MKKTTKALFSLLLVLVMVFQFGAMAPMARAAGLELPNEASVSINVSAPVDEEGNLSSNIYSLVGEVKNADVVSNMAELSDVAALKADGVVLTPPANFAVVSLAIAPTGSEKTLEPVTSEFASFTEAEDDHAAIVISADFFSDDKFNDSATAYVLYVSLAPVTSIASKIASCGSDGYKEYHLLASSGELYLDEEIPVVSATGEHKLNKVEAKPATPDSDGNIEYYECSVCEKFFSDADGKAEITDKDSVIIKYEAPAKTHTVTFMTSVGIGEMNPVEVKEGDEYTIPDCAFTDPTEAKEFDCWMLGEEAKNPGDKITVTADVTLNAQWKDKTPAPTAYTVTFDANGGSGEMADITVKAGEEYTVPACGFTAPEGKEFSRWMRGDQPLNPGDKDTLTSNNALVAEWKDKTPAATTLTEVKEVAATCEQDGMKAHYKDAEGNLFEDEAGTKPTTADALKIPAAHKLTHVEAVEATAEKDGNIEYWSCSECGKYFKDAEGKEEITDKTSVVTKFKAEEKAPTIIKDGTDTEWKQDSKDGLKIHIDATFDETLKDTLVVKIGDTVVPKDQYTVTSGSVIVTIAPAYLATLPAGTHTVNITFPSGNTVASTVTIAAAAPGVTAMAFAIDEAGFTKVYDGKTFDLDSLFDYVTLTNLPNNYTAEVEIAFEDASLTEFHNVGSTTVKLSLKSVKDASNNDVSSQFSCEDKTGVKLTITKRKITVETRDDSKVYDGKAWSYTHMSNAQPIMTYTDAKLGEYVRDGKTYVQTISIKYTSSPKNMGTYENKAELIIREKEKGSSEAGTDVTANYEITYKYGKIKITDSKGNVPTSGVATGDENNIWVWVGVMAAAVILVVVLLFVMRKNKKNSSAQAE